MQQDIERTDSGRYFWAWVIGIAVIALLVFLVLPALFTRDEASMAGSGTNTNTNTSIPGVPNTGNTVPVADIVKDPVSFAGQQVTLRGAVMDPVGRTFTLDEEGVTGGQDQIPVIAPTGTTLQSGSTVTVTGRVHRMTVAELEEELATDIATKYEVQVEDQPIIVAETVTRE